MVRLFCARNWRSNWKFLAGKDSDSWTKYQISSKRRGFLLKWAVKFVLWPRGGVSGTASRRASATIFIRPISIAGTPALNFQRRLPRKMSSNMTSKELAGERLALQYLVPSENQQNFALRSLFAPRKKLLSRSEVVSHIEDPIKLRYGIKWDFIGQVKLRYTVKSNFCFRYERKTGKERNLVTFSDIPMNKHINGELLTTPFSLTYGCLQKKN